MHNEEKQSIGLPRELNKLSTHNRPGQRSWTRAEDIAEVKQFGSRAQRYTYTTRLAMDTHEEAHETVNPGNLLDPSVIDLGMREILCSFFQECHSQQQRAD